MSNSGSSPIMALVIFVVMGLFTLWFGGLMLRAVDILYKPSVKKWMQNRPVWQHHKPDAFCPINNPTEDCLGPKTSFQEVDDEYLAKLEAEIKVLKAIKGFTSTADPKGKWKRQKKKNLLIDHNNTCPKTTLNTFFELLRNSARMCSVEKLLMD